MTERALDDPRWGDAGRERKARAILGTLRRARGDVPAGTWLDIGCGSGDLAAELCRVGLPDEMIGADPEPWARWQSLTANDERLRLLRADCESLAGLLGPACADLVVCNQVYEHVPDPQSLIRVIGELLRPGGLCYFAGPNLLWPIEPHVYWPFVHWLPRDAAQLTMRVLGSRRSHELDANSTSWRTLRRWFDDAGLVARSVLRERVAEEFAARGAVTLARVSAVLPRASFFEPLAPGFIYLLERPMAPGPR